MIFKSVNNIHTKADKAFFEELIGVYCKIVREICNIHSLEYKPCPTDASARIIAELISMGVISNENDLEQLKKLLKKEFHTFIYSIIYNFPNKMM